MIQAALVPTVAEMRSNATFDALMWALARPGRIQPLPLSGLAVLAESLLDRECTFFCSDEDLHAEIAGTGADAVALAQAEYVFTSLADGRQVAALADALHGNLLYPDASATIFAPATIGSGTRLRLSGPGIDGTLDIAVGGVDPAFWTLRAEAIRYPLGWDLYLAEAESLVGIPRSTTIEVL
jgi:alpha-D-ribose 1-methylphosphonate 5-triphosphate synthase subunit PhnH